MFEYNSVTWLPHLNCDIVQLEEVQRLWGFKQLTYKEFVNWVKLVFQVLNCDAYIHTSCSVIKLFVVLLH